MGLRRLLFPPLIRVMTIRTIAKATGLHENEARASVLYLRFGTQAATAKRMRVSRRRVGQLLARARERHPNLDSLLSHRRKAMVYAA